MRAEAPGTAASLEDWLRWQEALHPQAIALGLERVRAVAERLELPDSSIPTMTVAGTNGKGSCAALLSEIYRAAGYRVGTYTSPHLLRYNERVAVNGQAAADVELVQAFAAVEAARRNVPLTYFEFGTLAALHVFRQARVQVQVLEVGMGGRLDAVNIVDADCALITNIGLDHREFLGSDREQIGYEKAGVLRQNRPAVSADPDPPAVIRRQADLMGASLWQINEHYRYRIAADAWHWQGPQRQYKKLPPPGLGGDAQYRNAAGVLAVVDRMRDRLPVPETAVRSGLVRLCLPGRFERRGRVILDVAHNVEAAQVLADNLRPMSTSGFRVVLGMLSDKPVEQFCAVLASLTRKFYAGGLPPPRGLGGADLALLAGSSGREVEAFPTVEQAFRKAQADCMPDDHLVVCGSFLTVAAVLRHLNG